MKPYAAVFRGAGPSVFYAWGGWLTSRGMDVLTRKLRTIGIDADCYNFDQIQQAQATCRHRFDQGDPILLYSYSLGNTTALAIQLSLHVRLLFCIAMSEFAGINNKPIVKENVDHSVLWHGPGPFSDAQVPGFDEKFYISVPHLWMDLAAPVQASAMAEAFTILKQERK